MYECKLSLPPNAAFQTIIGPQSKNSHLSKQLVCLEACKKLHEMGALDDRLLPYVEKPSENEITVKCKGSANGAGMCMPMYELIHINLSMDFLCLRISLIHLYMIIYFIYLFFL